MLSISSCCCRWMGDSIPRACRIARNIMARMKLPTSTDTPGVVKYVVLCRPRLTIPIGHTVRRNVVIVHDPLLEGADVRHCQQERRRCGESRKVPSCACDHVLDITFRCPCNVSVVGLEGSVLSLPFPATCASIVSTGNCFSYLLKSSFVNGHSRGSAQLCAYS